MPAKFFFDFLGTIGGTQKSGQREYTKTLQLLFCPNGPEQELQGDRQLPRTAVQILNLESILPLKMVSVYLQTNVLKMTSRTRARYGKLTNV